MPTSFNAAEFRSRLQFGGQRPNSFRVTVQFPVNTTTGSASAATEEFQFMCSATTTPGLAIGTINVPAMGGRVIKLAGDRVYDDWQCRAYIDEDMLVNNALEAWQNRSNQFSHTTTRIENLNGLKGANGSISNAKIYATVKLELIGKENNVTKTYTLRNAFPVVLEPMELDFGADNQIVSRTVVFAYDYLETNGLG